MNQGQRQFIISKINKYYKQLKIANSDYIISIASTITLFFMMAYQIKRGSTSYLEIFSFLGAVSLIFTMLNISRKQIIEIRIIQLKEQLNFTKKKK